VVPNSQAPHSYRPQEPHMSTTYMDALRFLPQR
jgi:hypothetical protein